MMNRKCFFKTVLLFLGTIIFLSCGDIHFFTDDAEKDAYDRNYSEMRVYYSEDKTSASYSKKYKIGEKIIVSELPGADGFCTVETAAIGGNKVPQHLKVFEEDKEKISAEYDTDGYITSFAVPSEDVSFYGTDWEIGFVNITLLRSIYDVNLGYYLRDKNYSTVMTVQADAATSTFYEQECKDFSEEGYEPWDSGFGYYENNYFIFFDTKEEIVIGKTEYYSVLFHPKCVLVTINSGAGTFSDGQTTKTFSGLYSSAIPQDTVIPPDGMVLYCWHESYTCDQTDYESDNYGVSFPSVFPAYNTTYTAKYVVTGS